MSRTKKILAVATLSLAAFVAVGGAAVPGAGPVNNEGMGGTNWR